MKNTNNDWREIQFKLRRVGHSCFVTGEVDARTRRCIRNFQENYHLEATGIMDRPTEKKLNHIFTNVSRGKHDEQRNALDG